MLPLLAHGIPVNTTAPLIYVNFRNRDPYLALPQVSNEPEHKDDEEAEISVEKAHGAVDTGLKRVDGDIQLFTVRNEIDFYC